MVLMLKLPISQQFLNFSTYYEVTETCNTAMERKFCWLSEDYFKNSEKLPYELKFTLIWQLADLAFAELKSNFLRLFVANMASNV